MWKLGALFIIAALTATSAQNINLECQFQSFWNAYICLLDGITVSDPSIDVTFSGVHVENKTNADVTGVYIWNSNTPFVISQIFTTFPSLTELEIFDSNLQRVVIPAEAQLQHIYLLSNNISRIESGSFRNQTQLIQIFAMNNEIEAIDEDAFDDLHSLENIMFYNNKIQVLTPRTLAPLTMVSVMDFEYNLLTSIDENIFPDQGNLQTVFMGYNEIDKIHPQAFANMRESLNYISLHGNRCVDRSFQLSEEDDIERMLMHNLLRPCFHNYFGETPQARNMGMQFSGPLTIFDEFGNMVAKFD